jgi:MFS family permease
MNLHPARRKRTLLGHRDFLMVWSAATVSVVGSQVTLIAVPFIALTMLQASVFEVSLLAAVEMLPFLLFTLPAGAWLDRVRRRPVLIAADIVRGCALLTVPAAYVGHNLTLDQLYVVAFVTGSATAFFDVADQSYLPVILERDDLVEGNARLQVSYSIAQIGGPTLGGNLIAIVAAPIAIAIDALTFFVSGAFLSAVRRREAKPERRTDAAGRPVPMRHEIADGLHYVLGNPLLRPIAVCTGASNLFAAALFGIFPVLLWNELKLPPAFYGSVMGVASIGFLVGAATSDRVTRMLGIGPTIVFAATVGPPAFLLMVATPADLPVAAVTLGVGWFVAGLAQVLFNVAQVSLRQAITPPEFQSRMNATMRFIVWGTIPIGFIAGGVLATILPVRVALVIAALACTTSFLPVWFSPLRHLDGLPGETETPAARPVEVVADMPPGDRRANAGEARYRGLRRRIRTSG